MCSMIAVTTNTLSLLKAKPLRVLSSKVMASPHKHPLGKMVYAEHTLIGTPRHVSQMLFDGRIICPGHFLKDRNNLESHSIFSLSISCILDWRWEWRIHPLVDFGLPKTIGRKQVPLVTALYHFPLSCYHADWRLDKGLRKHWVAWSHKDGISYRSWTLYGFCLSN